MKRIFSILLLAILLFNWFGYRLLISFIEDKSDAQLESRLDENSYDESQLLSVRISITQLSYYNNSTQFERIDGQVEINGVRYKYVKRRLYNDSVELLCIPNQAAMRLSYAKNDFFRIVNDLQHNENKKNSSGISKNIPTDYQGVTHYFEWNDLLATASGWPTLFDGGLQSCVSSVIENPPEKPFPA